LVGAETDRRRQVNRLYRYVTDEIRYVGLELGEHRFRPFSADWVLAHRIGDCKDKAALLVALCGAVKIPARMVLLRTADEGPVAGSTAVLETFNHAIVYLPEDEWWLDATAAGHDPTLPPSLDQGAAALVIDGGSSVLETTPSPGAGVARSHITLARAEGGLVTLRVRLEDTGDAASERRSVFAGSADPRRFARWLQRSFPSAELIAEPVDSLQPGRDPTVIELEGSVPRAALLSGGGIPTFPGSLDPLSRLAPTGERRTPLSVPLRPDLEWTVVVGLGPPAGGVPAPVRLETEFGELSIAAVAVDEGYQVTGRFHLVAGLVPAAKVGALRDFLVAAERHLTRPLEVP
jgi:hypothetical protein